MLQIGYTSVATENFGSGDLFKIIDKSAKNNANAELTGFLIYSNGHFFQVIEGPIECVEMLMNRLKTDPRHHSIKIVCHSRTRDRAFPRWSMKRLITPEDSRTLDCIRGDLRRAPEKVRLAAETFFDVAAA